MAEAAAKQAEDVDLRTFLVDLTTDIVEELVDDRTKVKVTHKSSNRSLLITIHADDGELGKIIGKNGKTVCALRHLLRTMAFKEKIRVALETTDEAPK